jgi:hypothetical protein
LLTLDSGGVVPCGKTPLSFGEPPSFDFGGVMGMLPELKRGVQLLGGLVASQIVHHLITIP